MLHSIKFFKTMLTINLINNLQYKINFVLGFLINLVSSLVLIFFYIFVFDLFQTIDGWNKAHAILLAGTYIVISSFYLGFSFHSLSMLPSYIVQGELDGYLTRPVNTRLYISTKYIDFASILNGLLALALVAYVLITQQISISTLAIFEYALFIFLAFVFLSDMIFILMSMAFWFGDVSTSRDWFAQIIEFGNRPAFIYPKALKFIFYFFFPILLLGNIPLQLLLSEHSFTAYIVIGSIVCFHVLSKFIWKMGLRRYASAGN